MNKPTKQDIEKLVGKHKFNAMKKAFGLSYKFEDVTLADGTIVKVEPSVEEGASVYVIDGEGNELAAPDGDHQLEDGRVITTESGIIIQVLEAPAPSDVAPEMGAETPSDNVDVADILSKVNDRLTELESKFQSQTTLMSKIAALESKVNGIEVAKFARVESLEAVKAEIEEAKTLVVKMANEPVADPIKKPKKRGSQYMYSEDPAIEAFTKTIKGN